MSPYILVGAVALLLNTAQCSRQVSQKIAQAKDLIQQLKAKSDELDSQVDRVTQVVENFKCAFKTLKQDVEVLESANAELAALDGDSGPELERHDDEAAAQYEELQSAVEEKKETAETLRDFSHPCGGWGWERVAYMDFTRDDTQCPPGFSAIFPERGHTCATSPATASPPATGDCSSTILSFSPPGPYSSVCGRILAYQFGSTKAFNTFAQGANSVNLAYLTGVSLTRGGTTHIWSFAAGLSSNSSNLDHRCPCDGGSGPPPFVGGDHFCESALTAPAGPNEFDGVFFPGNLLWDGLGCSAASQCCSDVHHLPYFVKHLGALSSEDVDMRVCFGGQATAENVAIELIEIYVK